MRTSRSPACFPERLAFPEYNLPDMSTTTEISAAPLPTIAAGSAPPASAPALAPPGGRTPTLLQTAIPIEDRRAATEALTSWLGKLNADLPLAQAESISTAILTHFDLVPRGLGVTLRAAAREMHESESNPSLPADLSSLGAGVLLAVHEAYAAELSRPSATSLIESYLATRSK